MFTHLPDTVAVCDALLSETSKFHGDPLALAAWAHECERHSLIMNQPRTARAWADLADEATNRASPAQEI